MRINNRRWAALAVAALMALPGLAAADGLHDAAKAGDIEYVRALVDAGVDVDAKAIGVTALLLAAYRGHAEVVALLIEAGADVDAKDERGLMWLFTRDGRDRLRDNRDRTALMLAAREGHLEIAKLLIEAGADVDARDEHDRTALMYAREALVNSSRANIAKRSLLVKRLREAGAKE